MIPENYFYELGENALGLRKSGEHLVLALGAEESRFIRLNQAKVRQIGEVHDASLALTLIRKSADGLRQATRSYSLTGERATDLALVRAAIEALRAEAAGLPMDPYARLPEGDAQSSHRATGATSPLSSPTSLMADDPSLLEKLLPEETRGLDLVGFFASGPVIRGLMSSSGMRHWHEVSCYVFTYSLYTDRQKACKRQLSGHAFDEQEYRRDLGAARAELDALARPERKLSRGDYRVYLAPSAVAEIIQMFSFNCIGESYLRKGESPLHALREGTHFLSPKFTLWEDFRGGDTPRFNSQGELAPEALCLIEKGQLRQTLVSSRSAREFGVPTNAANPLEELRAPILAAGELPADQALAQLGEGIYLPSVHYLNWSQQREGRITGMTRHACFWIENGQRASPIENMRWDDSLFRIFGSELEALSDRAQIVSEPRSYLRRETGSTRTPGALLSSLSFTL